MVTAQSVIAVNFDRALFQIPMCLIRGQFFGRARSLNKYIPQKKDLQNRIDNQQQREDEGYVLLVTSSHNLSSTSLTSTA